MNSLLEELHDIEGLDPISWWPLSLGWWVLIAVAIVLMSLIIYFIVSRIAFKRSWKNDTFRRLRRLEEDLSEETSRETVIALSEYLRRIALKRFSRKECAGLFRESWLKWLTVNDPKKFDWEKKGRILIEVPYAPLDSSLPMNQIKDLIQAVRNWVR